MVKTEQLENTPMYKALLDLAGEMSMQGMPPVELNVIGGFALMMRGIRPADGVTDIDYVGGELPKDLTDLIAQVGLRHGMEAGWINNDGMFTGATMESFELSTGKLTFDHAITVGQMRINVLDEKDLLRMKIIAVDTAMTELEATGDFARMKDFGDIRALMDSLDMEPGQIKEEFGDYILCHPETEALLSEIYEKGPDAAIRMIGEKSEQIKGQASLPQRERSPFMENLMAGLMNRHGELKEKDLDFAEQLDKMIL